MPREENVRKSIILDVYSGTRELGKFAFDRDVVRIGRDPGCEIRLAFPTTSRVHCQVHRVADGFSLVDNGSINGTLLNGRPVTEALVETGDVISVGKFRIWVTIASTEESRLFPGSDGPIMPTIRSPDTIVPPGRS